MKIFIIIVFLLWDTYAFAEVSNKLYYRLSSGLATDTDLKRIVRGDLNVDDRRTGIIGLEIGKPLVEHFNGLPIDLVAKVGLIRHLERGLQNDFNQYTLSLKAYYKGFPWSDRVRTRLGLAQGISYADKIPFVERESLESRGRHTSHILNHLDLSFDANIGDIFNAPKLNNCYFGVAISHRSGIFGELKLYGEVDGGSNYNMLFIECLR